MDIMVGAHRYHGRYKDPSMMPALPGPLWRPGNREVQLTWSHGRQESQTLLMAVKPTDLGVGHIGDAVLPGHPLYVVQLGGEVVPGWEVSVWGEVSVGSCTRVGRPTHMPSLTPARAEINPATLRPA